MKKSLFIVKKKQNVRAIENCGRLEIAPTSNRIPTV